MASNDYYHVNKPPAAASPSPAPYYGGGAYNNIPSTSSTPAPPYSSIPNAPGASQPPPRQNTVSPFESVFDDHVYPVDSTQDGFRHNSHTQSPHNMNSMNVEPQRMNTMNTVDTAYGGHGQTPYNPHDMHQPNPYAQQDTAYYSQSSISPDASRQNVADDIPLQSRQPTQPHKDVEMNDNDHVYDAPQGSRRSKSRRDKKKVGFGQLGMFGADRKGIPWVVYIFTLVQVAVFIAEIVKNGKRSRKRTTRLLYANLPQPN